MYSFPLDESEKILRKGHASLHLEDSAFTGALYLTNERLVFVGYVMDITRKYMEDAPLAAISEIKGEKTFFVIPNAFSVTTDQGRKFRIIVDPGDRNSWLEAIKAEREKCME